MSTTDYQRAVSILKARQKAITGDQPTRPSGNCSYASFQRICRAANPPQAQVSGALQRLRSCRSSLGEVRYRSLKSCLVAKNL
jgi:hypothetical protein